MKSLRQHENIPDEDLPLIEELLQTLSIPTIAEKWEVSLNEFKTYLRNRGVNAIDLKVLHRKAYIKKRPYVTPKQAAIDLNIGEGYASKIIKAYREENNAGV